MGRRVLRFSELKPEKGIPYSRQHVDRLEKAGLFPKRVKLGPATVGWFDDELDALLEAKGAERSAA